MSANRLNLTQAAHYLKLVPRGGYLPAIKYEAHCPCGWHCEPDRSGHKVASRVSKHSNECDQLPVPNFDHD